MTEVVNRHPERIVLIRKYVPSNRELGTIFKFRSSRLFRIFVYQSIYIFIVGEVKSTSAVIKQLANLPEVREVCEHVGYTRIPLVRYRIPNFEVCTSIVNVYHHLSDI